MKEGWKVEKLGEVCDVLSGSGFPIKYQGQQDLEYPFYKVSDMNLPLNGKTMIQENNSIDSDVRGELRAKQFHAGTVIFPKVGGAILTNKKRIISKPSCVDNNIMGLYAHKNEICGDYLYWWMGHVDIYDWSNKASPPSITQKTVSNTAIPIPPLSEQEEIVEVLDKAFAAIDQAKANIEQNIANAKELFQSKLNQIFSPKGEGWVEKTLKDIGTVQTGTTPPTKDRSNYGDYMPFVKPAHFRRDGSINHGDSMLSESGLSKGRLFEARSVLMVCIGATIGKTGFTEIPVSSNQQINALTPSDDYEAKLLYYALISPFVQKQVMEVGKSAQATLPIINKSKWEKLRINLPIDVSEQRDIVKTLVDLKDQTMKVESHYQTKLDSLDELKKSILQKAFAGELT